MFTDYDAIAEEYRRAKRQPWRSRVEAFTLLELAGDVAGLAVLDLACGEGHYTRRLADRGAARVVGVDLSEEMIALAREQEAARPLGIEYAVGDGRTLGFAGEFHLVVAAYLLNYARDADELAAMARGIAGALRPGGRFVAVNSSPDLEPFRRLSFRPYGFDVEFADAAEGAPITWTFHLEGAPLRIENYHLGAATHERAFREAGFADVRWHRPRLAPGTEDSESWRPFLDNPPILFLECRRAGR
jgi:SAM-dependent methyltransferase